MSGYRQRRIAAQNRIPPFRVNLQAAKAAYRPEQKPAPRTPSADIHISICTTGKPFTDEDRRFIEKAIKHISGRLS